MLAFFFHFNFRDRVGDAPAGGGGRTSAVLRIRIRIKVKGRIRIRIRIKVKSWIRIQICNNSQATSLNVWSMSIFEHFFKVLSLYLQDRIQIRIKVKCRIRIRFKVKRWIRIRITGNIGIKFKTLPTFILTYYDDVLHPKYRRWRSQVTGFAKLKLRHFLPKTAQ